MTTGTKTMGKEQVILVLRKEILVTRDTSLPYTRVVCDGVRWRHGWPQQTNLSVVRHSLRSAHRSAATGGGPEHRWSGQPSGTQSLPIPRGLPPTRRAALRVYHSRQATTAARWIIQRQSMWITWCRAGRQRLIEYHTLPALVDRLPLVIHESAKINVVAANDY